MPGAWLQDSFHKLTGRADVGAALVAGFAFDAKGAAEMEVAQRPEKGLPIHLASADDDFLTPRAWLFGLFGVLDVALLKPRGQHAQRLNGIAFVVKNHVGGIKVHADI